MQMKTKRKQPRWLEQEDEGNWTAEDEYGFTCQWTCNETTTSIPTQPLLEEGTTNHDTKI